MSKAKDPLSLHDAVVALLKHASNSRGRAAVRWVDIENLALAYNALGHDLQFNMEAPPLTQKGNS